MIKEKVRSDVRTSERTCSIIKSYTTMKHIRKLTKASTHSYYVVIPKKIVEKYGWREKQKVVVEDEGRGKIVIRDWKKK